MQQAAQAYSKNALQAADPRNLEARALLHTASKIQAVKEEWESLPNLRRSLDEALTMNRRLWTFLLTSVTAEDNPLPVEVKSNIANLATFIFRRTIDLTFEPKREGLDVLIQINSNIAAGLRAPVANAPAAPAEQAA